MIFMNYLNLIVLLHILLSCNHITVKCEYSIHARVKNLSFHQMKIVWRQSDFPYLHMTYSTLKNNQSTQTWPFALNCSGTGNIALWIMSMNEDDETGVSPILCSTYPRDVFGEMMILMKIVADSSVMSMDLVKRTPRIHVDRITLHCKDPPANTFMNQNRPRDKLKESTWNPCHIKIIRPSFKSLSIKPVHRQVRPSSRPPSPTLIHISPKETGFIVKTLLPIQPSTIKNPILGCLIQIMTSNQTCILTTLWSRVKGKLDTIRPVVQSLINNCEKELQPDVREENGGIVFFTFNQMKSATTYSAVGYSINDGAYRISKTVTVTTKKPQVIQIIVKESKATSITLSIPKRDYPVTLLMKDRTGQVKEYLVKQNSDTITIDGLKPSTEYDVTWKRPLGDEIYEHKIPVKLQTKPPPSIQLAVVSIDHSSVTMKIIGGYKEASKVKITYAPGGTQEPIYLKPPEEIFHISGLSFNSSYSLMVEQLVNSTWHVQPDKMIITTTFPSIINISEYGSSTNTSFQLQWSSQLSSNVKISVKTSDNLIWQQVINVSTSSQVEVQDLTPYTVYTVSWEQQFDSTWIQNSKPLIVQTKASPSSEPRNISIENVTSSSAIIIWREPQFPNGIITDYCIVCNADNSMTKEKCQSSTNETFQSHDLSDLSPFTSYSCRVYTKSNGGNGLFSSQANFITEEAISEKVENLLIKELSNDEVQVQWNPPRRSNGRIQHYIVFLYQHSANNTKSDTNCVASRIISLSSEKKSSSNAQTLRETEVSGLQNLVYPECLNAPTEQMWTNQKDRLHSVSFRGLPSFHNYSVQVLPVNKAGVGQISTSRNNKGEEKSMEPLVAGASIAFLLLAILITTILYILMRWRNMRKGKQRRLSPTGPPLLVQENAVYSLPIPKIHLREYVETMNADQNPEFHKLMKILKVDSVNGDMNAVVIPQGGHHEQPHDHCEKVIQNPLWKKLPGGADYMNADWIPMDDKNHRLPLANGEVGGDEKTNSSTPLWIAAQGPHGAMCADFWKMVWTNKTDFVVMLNSDEMIDICCDQYWPDTKSEPLEQGDFEIVLKHEKIEKAYALRTLEVCHTVTNERCLVHQLQYLKEMDRELNSLKDFHCFMEQFETLESIYRSSKLSSILVHCTSGTGRTGSFLAIVKLLSVLRITEEEYIDVLSTILELRKNRENLVESQEQLEFIFQYLLFFYENYVVIPQKKNSMTMNECV